MKENSTNYIADLRAVFEKHADSIVAEGQAAYMKYRNPFFGIKTPIRREIQKPFLEKSQLPEPDEAIEIIRELWAMDERELHYFAQELLWKYKKDYSSERKEEWLGLMRFLIENQSWWDTVDFISPKPLAHFLKLYPERRYELSNEWIDTGHLWLQRAALLFQLKYKGDTDTELLKKNILRLKDTKEFFLNKAIGWMLREYSKTNPDWVREFIATTRLSNLSHREGSKYI